jgi:hypothetical protein
VNILTAQIFVLDEKFGRYFLGILDNLGVHVFVTFQVVLLDGPLLKRISIVPENQSINYHYEGMIMIDYAE